MYKKVDAYLKFNSYFALLYALTLIRSEPIASESIDWHLGISKLAVLVLSIKLLNHQTVSHKKARDD